MTPPPTAESPADPAAEPPVVLAAPEDAYPVPLLAPGAPVTPLTDAIAATAAAFAADPDAARFTLRAAARAHGPLASTVRVVGHDVEVDEPTEIGGGGTAPNPVAYHLAALLSCQIVTYRFYADRLGLRIDALDATVEGDMDRRGFFALRHGTRPGLGAVRIVVRIEGPESAADYERLREIVDAHCPVLDITQNPVGVTTSLDLRR